MRQVYAKVHHTDTVTRARIKLKVALSFSINKFHKTKYLKELAYIYYDACF